MGHCWWAQALLHTLRYLPAPPPRLLAAGPGRAAGRVCLQRAVLRRLQGPADRDAAARPAAAGGGGGGALVGAVGRAPRGVQRAGRSAPASLLHARITCQLPLGTPLPPQPACPPTPAAPLLLPFPLLNALQVIPGIYLGAHEAAVAEVTTGGLQQSDFRFFAGCLAWEPGQLAAELAAGAWHTAACSRSLVLKQCLQVRWPEGWVGVRREVPACCAGAALVSPAPRLS